MDCAVCEPYLGHVGDGDVSALAANVNREVGFERRFVKTGERRSCARRLKLCGGQHPVNINISKVFSEIIF